MNFIGKIVFFYFFKMIKINKFNQNLIKICWNIVAELIFGIKIFLRFIEVIKINLKNRKKNICSYLIYKRLLNKEIKTKNTRKYGFRLFKEL